MADNKEGPAKDAGRPVESAAVKRPHATLDLKATEVKEAQTKAPEATVTKPAGAAPAPEAKAAPKPQETKAAQAGLNAPSRGTGGLLTHLLAGVAGGGLALAGLTALAPKQSPGLDPALLDQKTAVLEQRLASLETAASVKPVADEPLAKELQGKVGESEARLAKLEEAAAQIAALTEAQTKLTVDAKELADKVASAGATDADRERIGKLEERLQLLSAAADAEPDGGRIPQLAAITGKITELETSLATEISALKASVTEDMTSRLAAVTETGEATKSGIERIDRDIAGLREDGARLDQRLETLKAGTGQLSATSHVLKEESGTLSSALGQLKSAIEAQLKGVARPADVQAAVVPVSSRLASLEQSLAGVVRSEDDRRANTERIVLSLELANLKRVLESGAAYSAALAQVRKVAAGRVDLAVLERYRDEGVATDADLARELKPVINAVIDADTEPVDGTVVDRLIAGAKSVVRVRKISHEPGDTSAEALVGRIEVALKEGRLGDVIELARSVPQRASAPLQDWLGKVEARHAVDQAIAVLDEQLKTSLGGGQAVPAHKPAKPAAR